LVFQAPFAFSAINTELKSPWVYPKTINDPTTSEYYKVLLASGINNIDIVIWNNHPNWDFINGSFVIAVKSGLTQVSINNINLTKNAENLTGSSTPGNFSLATIFPCSWLQYTIPNYLADLRNASGYQGVNDTSGMVVTMQIAVTGDPSNVKLYFLAWGNKLTESGLVYTESPISHITETTHILPPTPVPSPYLSPSATHSPSPTFSPFPSQTTPPLTSTPDATSTPPLTPLPTSDASTTPSESPNIPEFSLIVVALLCGVSCVLFILRKKGPKKQLTKNS
jgi:hypothetical protein